jgi:hypothetical protein
VSISFDLLENGAGNALLADARLSQQQNHLPFAFSRLLPPGKEECDVLFPSNHGRDAASMCLEPALHLPGADHAPDRNGLGKAFQGLRWQSIEIEGAANEPARCRSDQDTVWLDRAAEPTRSRKRTVS